MINAMISNSLDAVILAGGESHRLAQIVPPYHKPFLVVRGQSLLWRNVELAVNAGAERIIVVTCSEIAVPVTRLLEQMWIDPNRLHVVLRTGGPGVALWQGVQLCRGDRTLVLMADNWNRSDDIEKICDHRFAVGVREVPAYKTCRYTRFEDEHWTEGEQTREDNLPVTVWCGPLLVDTLSAFTHLNRTDGLIGPHLGDLVPSDGTLVRVPVQSHDLGTPESLKEFTNGAY